MLVFFGPFTRFFALFEMEKNRKKSKKWPKNRVFSSFFKFFLMLCGVFSHISVLHNMLIFLHFRLQNKNTKKTKNNILKLFFKNKNWTFIFVHFQILKRVSKK
jgi:hypothetical protein